MQKDKAKEPFCFQEVKKYSRYLLQNRLDDISRENIRMLEEHKLPLLGAFSHLSKEELFVMTRSSLEQFLTDVEQDTSLANAIVTILRWKENKIPGIERNTVKAVDLIIVYSIRKQLFLKFLPDYTTDCQVFVAIMQELEQFHIELERYAFETFVEIQKEDLSHQNEFLTSLVQSSEDSIIAFDREGRLTEWNRVAERMFSKKKEELIGQKLTDAFPKLLTTGFYTAMQRSLTGERIKLQRQKYVHRKGWYDATLVPLIDSMGSVNGALSVIHDVTEDVIQEDILKEHQEKLLASNEELQESLTQLEETQEILKTAVDQLEEAQTIAHLGNWEYDVSRNLVFWSRELRRIYGIAEDELDLSYNTYLERIHPDDREMVSAAIAACFEQKQPYHFEHRIIRPDGSLRWILGQGKPTVSASGKLIKLKGTGKDITERKLAELKVLEEQHFIQKVTDTTPDVITVFDLEKRVNIYGNRELYEVLGYTAEEVKEFREQQGTQWIFSLLHPEDLPRFFAFIESLRSYTGTEAREIEYRGKNRHGDYLWVLGRYNIFKRNETGQATQIIGISRNITKRKQAEQLIRQNEAHLRELNQQLEEQVQARTAELTRKNQQLLRINADLDNFIYTASHDLKAPIANLEGLLTLLDPKIRISLTEREQDLLEMMHQSIKRFKKTIKDLTDIAQMQKELEEETAEVVNLAPLLKDIQADISNLIKETSTQISTQLEVEEFGYNQKNLRSILHNLITNAIKYSQPGRAPQINISTHRLGDYIVMKIADNGQGIPEKHHERIFSLFKRLHKNIEGSGMGLYIVKRILENSGGRIEVESEVGKGSVFTLYLRDQAIHEK